MARPKATLPLTTSAGTAIELNAYINENGQSVDLRAKFGGNAEVPVNGGATGATVAALPDAEDRFPGQLVLVETRPTVVFQLSGSNDAQSYTVEIDDGTTTLTYDGGEDEVDLEDLATAIGDLITANPVFKAEVVSVNDTPGEIVLRVKLEQTEYVNVAFTVTSEDDLSVTPQDDDLALGTSVPYIVDNHLQATPLLERQYIAKIVPDSSIFTVDVLKNNLPFALTFSCDTNGVVYTDQSFVGKVFYASVENGSQAGASNATPANYFSASNIPNDDDGDGVPIGSLAFSSWEYGNPPTLVANTMLIKIVLLE